MLLHNKLILLCLLCNMLTILSQYQSQYVNQLLFNDHQYPYAVFYVQKTHSICWLASSFSEQLYCSSLTLSGQNITVNTQEIYNTLPLGAYTTDNNGYIIFNAGGYVWTTKGGSTIINNSTNDHFQSTSGIYYDQGTNRVVWAFTFDYSTQNNLLYSSNLDGSNLILIQNFTGLITKLLNLYNGYIAWTTITYMYQDDFTLWTSSITSSNNIVMVHSANNISALPSYFDFNYDSSSNNLIIIETFPYQSSPPVPPSYLNSSIYTTKLNGNNVLTLIARNYSYQSITMVKPGRFAVIGSNNPYQFNNLSKYDNYKIESMNVDGSNYVLLDSFSISQTNYSSSPDQVKFSPIYLLSDRANNLVWVAAIQYQYSPSYEQNILKTSKSDDPTSVQILHNDYLNNIQNIYLQIFLDSYISDYYGWIICGPNNINLNGAPTQLIMNSFSQNKPVTVYVENDPNNPFRSVSMINGLFALAIGSQFYANSGYNITIFYNPNNVSTFFQTTQQSSGTFQSSGTSQQSITPTQASSYEKSNQIYSFVISIIFILIY